jgi:arylsulfatase A-like enzyme
MLIAPASRSSATVAGRESSRRADGPAPPRFGWSFVVALGLLTGLGEAAFLAFQKLVRGRFLHLSPQTYWMSPVAALLLFLVVAAAFRLLSLRWRSAAAPRGWLAVLATLMWLDWLLLLSKLPPAASALLALGLGVQTARWLAPSVGSLRRAAGWASLAMGTWVALVAIGMNGARAWREHESVAALAAAPAGAPNVLLLILDTVRAQELSLYGYARPTTPNLERWATRGTTFDHAFSTASWTLPSHASMFTGKYPYELGGADWFAPLAERERTLAEYLHDRGYRTGGFVANLHETTEESGLAQGFDRYEDYLVLSPSQLVQSFALGRRTLGSTGFRHLLHYYEMPGRKDAARVDRQFLDWLDGGSSKPFFAFLNYFDAHAPYLPPASFQTAFGAAHPGRNPLFGPEDRFTPERRRAEVDAYDETIAYLDREIGRLLDELDRRGVLRNTIVVIAADHGEEFGRHGLNEHGYALYAPTLHVPLLIIAPSRVPAGRRVDEWVSLRDLPRTITDLLGDRSAAFPGSSLARYWAEDGSPEEPLVAQVSFAPGLPSWIPVSKGDMVSVLQDPYQYIRGGDGTETLFDARRDSTEMHPLPLRSSGVLEALRTRAAAVARVRHGASGR